MTKFYSNKSNALRAAKSVIGYFEIKQEAGKGFFVWTPEAAAAAHVADVDSLVPDSLVPDSPVVDAPVLVAEAVPVVTHAIPAAPVDPAPLSLSFLDAEIFGDDRAPAATVAPAVEAPILMELRVYVPANIATQLAFAVARRIGNPVAIWNPATGNRIGDLVNDDAPLRKEKAASGSPRATRVKGDLTVKPIITAASQRGMQGLFDRIEAARGDLGNLEALNKFSRSGTYYKMAGRYIDALIAEAGVAEQAAPVGVEVGRVAA